jgi:cytochrome c-type biogenesis protein CcmF
MLSVGILLGAQWAYVELGWGGYWAWDPVENASLLPWLTGTALIHSIMIQQHRGIGKLWNAVLIALTFVLCIFGTYLTRSGVIQSVHGFGESLVGTFFLAFLFIVILFNIGLIIGRIGLLKAEHTIDGLLGREAMFLATNVLLVLMTAVILVGTIFPIISRAFLHQEITVGANFYNKVVGPLSFSLVAMMALGPSLSYGAEAARRLVRGMVMPAIVGAVITAAFWRCGLRNAWALVCVAITTVLLANVLYSFIQSLIGRLHSGDSVVGAIVHLLDGNHRRYGGQIVHIGMILLIVGVTASSLFQNKRDLELHPGDNVQLAGQMLHFNRLTEVRFANYTAVVAEMTLTDAGGNVTKFQPQRRFYDKSEEPNTEVSLKSGLQADYYFTLAGWENNGQTVAIQALVNPLVSWIWIGGIVMSAGAVLCLLPRIVPRPVEMFETVQQSSKTQAKATRRSAKRELQHA